MKFNEYQEVLEVPPTVLQEIDQFKKKFDVRYRLWKYRDEFEKNQTHWYNDNFVEIDAEEVVKTVDFYKKEKVGLKQSLPREPVDKVFESLEKEIKEVDKNLELIQALGNKNMQQKHWEKVRKLLDSGNLNFKNFNLVTLLEEGIDKHHERVIEISGQASGEAMIQQTLQEIEQLWGETYFTV